MNKPCLNNGTCITTSQNTFMCFCTSEFTGSFCDMTDIPKEQIVNCNIVTCLNGGTCITINQFYHVCLCTINFSGTLCESAVEVVKTP